MIQEKNLFKNEILNLVALKQEGEYWDFKKEWHMNKNDLLHDIICMANNLVSKTAYIIIGIDEENDYSLIDVTADPNRRTTQNLVDFLRNKYFAGGFRPRVYVDNMDIEGQMIDIIVILSEPYTPFYLTKDYQGVFANNIYTRVMDTNTPKTHSADFSHIEYLWRKRFGLTSTPLERVQLLLKDPTNWLASPDDSLMIEFYKYAPEYTIEKVDTDQNDYEFYLFGQTDSRPHWYDINIKYHQTLIASVGGVGLDGGRFFTATPQSGTVCFGYFINAETDIAYKYFIKGTLEYDVYQYYLLQLESCHGDFYVNNRYMECILVFKSEKEKCNFDLYVKEHFGEFALDPKRDHLPTFPEIDGYHMEYFKKQYSDAIILQKLLKKFRIVK